MAKILPGMFILCYSFMVYFYTTGITIRILNNAKFQTTFCIQANFCTNLLKPYHIKTNTYYCVLHNQFSCLCMLYKTKGRFYKKKHFFKTAPKISCFVSIDHKQSALVIGHMFQWAIKIPIKRRKKKGKKKRKKVRFFVASCLKKPFEI